MAMRNIVLPMPHTQVDPGKTPLWGVQVLKTRLESMALKSQSHVSLSTYATGEGSMQATQLQTETEGFGNSSWSG